MLPFYSPSYEGPDRAPPQAIQMAAAKKTLLQAFNNKLYDISSRICLCVMRRIQLSTVVESTMGSCILRSKYYLINSRRSCHHHPIIVLYHVLLTSIGVHSGNPPSSTLDGKQVALKTHRQLERVAVGYVV